MRILVTGSNGQLGREVCRELQTRNIDCIRSTSLEMDIKNRCAVMDFMEASMPDAVIHCAGYTKVDQAEEAVQDCWTVNVDGTWNLAKACKKVDAKMLYISSDYVFSGTSEKPYEISDSVNPRNVYGMTKLAGELAVKSLLEKYFIVRTSWLFSESGNNFVKTMLQLAQYKKNVRVVSDQIGSPTYAGDLSRLLCDMVVTERYGTYHATNGGYCSWAEFAKAIYSTAGMNIEVEPILSEEYNSVASRPLNSRLSKASIEANGFDRLPNWRDSLNICLKNIEFLNLTRRE